jgi:hypothetical protein
MWNFIDWGYSADTAAPDGKTAILNVLIAAALKRAAGLHEAAGNPERAEGLRRLSRSTMAAVTRKFWMPKRARFNDSTDPFQGRHTVSQHPHGVALFFGLLDKAQEQGALDALTDPSVVPAELYFQHFGINSLAHAGRAQQAMDLIRRLWGAMIEQDSPTVWETVRGRDAFSGCGSLCHGFACTPLYFMHNTLLGVQALKPGFAEFRLAPQGLGLLWAKGNVPTPHGVIRVNWARQADQALVIDVDVPDGATAILPDSRRLGPGRHIVS